MPRITKKYLENIFRSSVSSDELFDNFRIAIDRRIKDLNLYRILLWNKALSPDEIMMFAEKICRVHPVLCYQIYYWVGKIFSTQNVYGEHYEKAFEYLMKAAKSNPSAHEPYIAVTKLYSVDIDLPRLDLIAKTIDNGIKTVDKKSKLCFAISKLYKSTGDIDIAKSYQKLGEKYQREGW